MADRRNREIRQLARQVCRELRETLGYEPSNDEIWTETERRWAAGESAAESWEDSQTRALAELRRSRGVAHG